MEYQKINSTKLRVVDMEAKGESSEGGEVKKYYEGDTLRKIVSLYFGEMGKVVNEYYFLGGVLCFAYITRLYYDKPLSGKVTKTEKDRYYFDNCMYWLNYVPLFRLKSVPLSRLQM